MHLGKGQVIIVAFVCSVAGVQAVLAKPSQRPCVAQSAHIAQTCHCGPKFDHSARYRRRLISGFETEYDVEKWEKAYRQGLVHWGSQSKHRPCVSSG
jgi:hypothetical protein